MSRKSVPSTPATTSVPSRAVSAELADLLHDIEDRCNHAAGIVNATARVVGGDELGLQDEDVPSVYAAALDHVAAELEGLADRALKVRTTSE